MKDNIVVKGETWDEKYRYLNSKVKITNSPTVVSLDVIWSRKDEYVEGGSIDLSNDAAVELAMGLLKFGGSASKREAFETLIAKNRNQVKVYNNIALYAKDRFKGIYLSLAEAHEKTAELLEAYIWEG